MLPALRLRTPSNSLRRRLGADAADCYRLITENVNFMKLQIAVPPSRGSSSITDSAIRICFSARTRRVLAAAAAIALIAGCGGRSSSHAHPSAPVENVLDTITVHQQRIASQLVLNAQVTANPTRVVDVYPPASGRVLTLSVLPGEPVREGQRIATLESSEAAQARSDYTKAKIEAARADVQLARARDLVAHQAMAVNDLENVEALDAADHADLKRAQQALVILGLTPRIAPGSTPDIIALRSPISGVVLSVGAAPGELQRSLDNAGPIATVAAINPVWVVGNLYPRDLDSVRVGQPAAVSVVGYPGMVLHGVINSISDAVDPSTLTLKARVVLPNPGYKLKPGMYATITVTDNESTGFAVPSTAVIRDGKGSAYVFVMGGDGKPVRREIALGADNDGTYSVLHGLDNGDRVVTTGAELLREEGNQ